MAATIRRRKNRLGKLDALGLIILIAAVVGILYLVDQRGQQAASEPSAVLPASVINGASSMGDATGRDLNTVPRYPNSRRLFYTEKDTSDARIYSVMYGTSDDMKPVSAFYENEMPKHGWRLIVKSEAVLRMDFVRYSATSAIGVPEVSVQFSHVEGNTTITIIATEPKKQ